ncbi:MAG: twin-arginine translocase TatA/TatE family subunit [Armatimonadota bacterium]
MFGLGTNELLVILLIIFLLFGAKKLPDIMKSFGQGIREFKRESSKIVSEIESAVEEEPTGSSSSSPAPEDSVGFEDEAQTTVRAD